MVAGRDVALMVVFVAGLLALLDVRPDTRPAPGNTGARLDLAEVAGGPSRADVRAIRGVRAGSPGETTSGEGHTLEVRGTETGGQPRGAVVVDRGDGHSFGYARGVAGSSAEARAARPAETGPAPLGGATARGATRPWAWTWRPGENSGTPTETRVAWTDAVATVRHGSAPTSPVPDGERAIRVTQTLAYLHGSPEGEAASEGVVDVTLPEDPTGIELVPDGSDTGVESDLPTQGAAPKATNSRHRHGARSSAPPAHHRSPMAAPERR